MSSNVAITTIRTGNGDAGDTKTGGKVYRKGHKLIIYSGALDMTQALTPALPKAWGDYEPRGMLQELLFSLGAVVGSRTPKNQELLLSEVGIAMEAQVEFIASGLQQLNTFIRSTDATADLFALRTALRMAECHCVAARDQIEVEAKDTSPNLIYMLEASAKALNIASDWVYAYLWLLSVNPDTGDVLESSKWKPWTEERIRKLNLVV